MTRLAILLLVLFGATSMALAGEAPWDTVMRGGQVLIQHLPTQVGGPASDTEFDFLGSPLWQQLADEIYFSQDSLLSRVDWWGFYNDDNPPLTETMRIRIYEARLGDSLPDETSIVLDTSVTDPFRIATGEQVAVGIGPAEFLYSHHFKDPILLQADTLYWLEIVQLGDITTAFRWEVGTDPLISGHAFKNPITVDWTHTVNTVSDQAFVLYAVPEPSVAMLLALGGVLTGVGRRRTLS